jgi:hypothetical protein
LEDRLRAKEIEYERILKNGEARERARERENCKSSSTEACRRKLRKNQEATTDIWMNVSSQKRRGKNRNLVNLQMPES